MKKAVLIAIAVVLGVTGLAEADRAALGDSTLSVEVIQRGPVVQLDVDTGTTTGAAPPLLNRLVLRLPAGTEIRSGSFRRCKLAALQAEGPSACPRGSRLGSGPAGGIHFLRPIAGRLLAFNGSKVGDRDTVLMHWAPTSAPTLVFYGKWRLRGHRPVLDMSIAPIRILAGDPGADVQGFALRLGSTFRGSYLMDARCPGRWSVQGFFATGTALSVADKARCLR